MPRIIFSIPLILVLFVAATGTGKKAVASPNNTVCTVESIQLEYQFNDRGGPVVVFEAGLGFGMETWAGVLDALGGVTTLAYNRPGYGNSGTGCIDDDGLRTGREVAAVLYTLLEDIAPERDIVLVAHSLGGLYAMTYAVEYPENVAGIVLVDGRPKHYQAACRETNLPQCAPQPDADWPPHIRAEARGTAVTEADAPDFADLTPVPVVVLVPADPVDLPGWAAFRPLWNSVQAAAVETNPQARLRYVADSGHFIHIDQPQAVLEEIRRILREIED